jgi:hypothetical protein
MSLEIGNMYRDSHTFLLSLYVYLDTLLACLGSINMSWGPVNMLEPANNSWEPVNMS